MLEHKDGNVILTCDDCGFTSTYPEGLHNSLAYLEGWGVKKTAKKYKHKCPQHSGFPDGRSYTFEI